MVAGIFQASPSAIWRHGAAQDLARARLWQALDDHDGLERGDRADLVAHQLHDFGFDLFVADD